MKTVELIGLTKKAQDIKADCGCCVRFDGDGIVRLSYCPKHAAAPEMYDALSEMLARMDDDNWDAEKAMREKVRAILLKLTCK